MQGAAVGMGVDANNRQLHHDEKDLIARKANGDKNAEGRLMKAACYEVKCRAQFPEGSPLYKQNFVSPAEAFGLTQEIAWINEQKVIGAFEYTPFQKLTDRLAATTGISSVNGLGTFNGQFISKPSQPFMSNDCVTAECAAGMAPFRRNNPPDYVSVQGNIYIASGGFTVNLQNGSIFAGGSLGRTYPTYSVVPGFSVTTGRVIGGTGASDTNEFLGGGGAQVGAFYPISSFKDFGTYMGEIGLLPLWDELIINDN